MDPSLVLGIVGVVIVIVTFEWRWLDRRESRATRAQLDEIPGAARAAVWLWR
ncbi:MAG TPA: hypothetical protein VFG53_20500 [Anaeromyxobacter sp.]|nr:hypothetical protein [Anaeromyxobacter sp.]